MAWDILQTSFGSDDSDTMRRDSCGPSDEPCTNESVSYWKLCKYDGESSY
jgi:hypothetical protein